MRRRLTAGNVAALVLGTLMLLGGFTRTASAFEWDLPGERKLSIHGFYESRLLFVGSDLPANGATWSSFRHVLSTEGELTIFPDGFGPFDSMFMFTRFLVSYECIYSHACWTASSANSYGDDKYQAKRQPLSLKEDVKNNSPYFAGLLPQKYRPGSLAPTREVLNPNRKYRDCENPPGVFANPWPLAVFCNLNNKSPLDGPIQGGTPTTNEVRAGTFTPLSRPALLAAARPTIGEAEFQRIQNLLLSGSVLSRGQEAERRSLELEAYQASADGNKDLSKRLQAQADAILGSTDTTFDANIPELLGTRPDPNRFAQFANSLAPDLLKAKWGSSQLRNQIWPFLATINTPITPQGYFASARSLDIVGQYEQGLANDLNATATLGGLPTIRDSDNQVVLNTAAMLRRSDPFYIGPDGVRDTADDLPFVKTNDQAAKAGYTLAAPIAGTTQDRFDEVSDGINVYTQTAQITVDSLANPGTTKLVELYGIYNPVYLAKQSCPTLGGTYDPTTGQCTGAGGKDLTAQATQVGCQLTAKAEKLNAFNIGINADGDCIELNTRTRTFQQRLQVELLPLLGDPAARPKTANSEPLDLTDLQLYADQGLQLPARPRSNKNGVYFLSPGARKQYEQFDSLVSNLDLKYSVDELQWNHGASQEEHEFMEGYLEFEMADSQIYTRVGKLIQVWGKTELFRNQDRNNPLDIGNGLFAPLEEQRVGQWAVDMTFSPEIFMRIGPVEDLRLEFLTIFNPFEPTDLGKCGEGTAVDYVCLKSFGAMANGLAAVGVIGEHRPYKDYSGTERWDFGARLEGRLDRFTFAISDFWGWDDGFYLDVVQHYERTSDSTTGAPLSVTNFQTVKGCKIRTNSEGVPVGPNGIAGDGDDSIPSQGQCLLWNKPDAQGVQTLRSPNAVAKLQNVNQTVFHSLCSYTFDPDEGYCAFDRVNDPRTFGFISQILSGRSTLGGIVLDGTETIRTLADGVVYRTSPNFRTTQFLAINPLAAQTDDNQDLGNQLQPEQQALLGCGPAYASPCSRQQAVGWLNNPALAKTLTRDPVNGAPQFGGLDLMNADASVITQEFVGIKALSPGALVGTRQKQNQKLYYQPGINYSRNGTTVSVPGPAGQPMTVEQGSYLNITPDQVIKMGRVGRAQYQTDPNNPREADGWVEPMPWTVNQDYLKKFGAIVFNTDPNAPFDLNSPLNKWNLIDKNQPVTYSNIDGEYCARWMNTQNQGDVSTPFNAGCTGLEAASANFERLLIATEIIGADRMFDPPESLKELGNWSKSNTDKQAAGDPISGPDGIFARNQYVLNDEEVDFEVTRATDQIQLGTSQIDKAPADKAGATQFLLNYDPNTQCLRDFCYMQVNDVLSDPGDAKSTSPLVIDMPIGTTVNVVELQEPNDPNQPPVPEPTGQTRKINLAKLQFQDLTTLRNLFAGKAVQIDGTLVQMSTNQRTALLGPFDLFTPRGRDLDGDLVTDLDRDRDGVWDGQDDGMPGPITDDNILCGSGIPGDKLEDGMQYQPYRKDQGFDSEGFKRMFPDGLPPRSPVFCRSISGLTSATSQTLPVKKAGGDGHYGRRDFLWQGGQQVAFNYQKKNVFGFGLDFAEDVTKTSWGVEFSWMANKIFQNSLEYDGTSKSDEMVLSLSVDRPTFFNFLNPNRSFFLNLQTFIRYLPNYQGGPRNNDGMYGSAAGPVTGNIVFTFFTGYFQDRLAPRVSLLYAPFESQGAALTALSYRWNDAFSTTIGYTQFFGHVDRAQGYYYPISQYGSIQDYDNNPVTRGLAPVLYRDQAELRIRYTW
jgi:hypothetical protein